MIRRIDQLLTAFPFLAFVVFILGNVALLIACLSGWMYLVLETRLVRYPWLIIGAFPTYFLSAISFYTYYRRNV